MKRFAMAALAAILTVFLICAACAEAAAIDPATTPEGIGQDVSTEAEYVSDPEAIEKDFLERVALMPEGVAGASLKQAIVAAQVVRFAYENGLWNADGEALRQDLQTAFEGMDPGDRSDCEYNLRELLVPLMHTALDDYEAVRAAFEDAGVGEDMAALMENAEARASWLALEAAALELSAAK